MDDGESWPNTAALARNEIYTAITGWAVPVGTLAVIPSDQNPVE